MGQLTDGIEEQMRKQESLLSDLHLEIRRGYQGQGRTTLGATENCDAAQVEVENSSEKKIGPRESGQNKT